jgi:hypothetical protein
MNDAIEMMTVFSGRLSAKMSRARERCTQVGESERLLGFTATADMYKEIATEIGELAMWAWQEENRLKAEAEEKKKADPYAGDDVYPDCLYPGRSG